VESWNDERLDELSRRMNAGFEKAATKEEMNRRFDGVESQLGRVNDRLDKLIYGIVGILGTFAAATFATILGSVMS
jgi:hypothetical protein